MKINKNGYLFSIVFTCITTFVLVFPLTLAYTGTKPIADNYWRVQHYVKTLKSLGITADASTPDEAKATYASLKKYEIDVEALAKSGSSNLDLNAVRKDPSALYLKEVGDDVINKALQDSSYTGNLPVFFYTTEVNGQKRFAGDFTGPGLWGNVSLAVGVNADGSVIDGVQVLFNVETPGLGGRIGEKWFTAQFTGLQPGAAVAFNQSGQKVPNGFDAIAGATITSTAVKDIINTRALVLLRALIAQKGGAM